MTNRIWILGAPDPEMELIERLLRESGESVVYATGEDGRRVHPGNAYRCPVPAVPEGSTAYAVECIDVLPEGWVRIDHHRPGDPGYGRPPAEFMPASSLGQVMAAINGGTWHWWPGDGYTAPTWQLVCDGDVPVTLLYGPSNRPEIVLAAAADHCLAAAYRGECPGVEPDALMRWRVESRAAFQRRSVEDVLADVERAREALMDAPVVRLSPEPWEPACGVHGRTGACWQSGGPDPSVRTDACYALGDTLSVVDMRGQHVPELPEAAARDGVCFIASITERNGRIKVVCQSGTPEQIEAFMRVWAPAQGLTDIYGDPARGFAGGYLAP